MFRSAGHLGLTTELDLAGAVSPSGCAPWGCALPWTIWARASPACAFGRSSNRPMSRATSISPTASTRTCTSSNSCVPSSSLPRGWGRTGLAKGWNYFIGRPGALPARLPSPEAEHCLNSGRVGACPATMANTTGQVCAAALLMEAPSVSPETPAEEVLDLMLAHPTLDALAVVVDGRPVGIIHRAVMMDRYIRLYSRELFGRRPSRIFMDPEPMGVDQGALLHDLSALVVHKGKMVSPPASSSRQMDVMPAWARVSI